MPDQRNDPDDCDHTALEAVEVRKDGRGHIEGLLECDACGSVFSFSGGPL
jgi:hypothetical protein